MTFKNRIYLIVYYNSLSGASPSSKRAMFSPENHRKHISAFKQRESEKKHALEERRKKQDLELDKKRLQILKKHQEADKRVSSCLLPLFLLEARA